MICVCYFNFSQFLMIISYSTTYTTHMPYSLKNFTFLPYYNLAKFSYCVFPHSKGKRAGHFPLPYFYIYYLYPGLTTSLVSALSPRVQHGNLLRQHAIKAWAPGHDTSPEILPVSVQ